MGFESHGSRKDVIKERRLLYFRRVKRILEDRLSNKEISTIAVDSKYSVPKKTEQWDISVDIFL